jgi:drug/metabolite transporter (DMT)-like permease
MSLHFGILFALLCAFATNLAFLYKHRGAAVAAKVDVRRPVASAVALFRSPWFAIGMLVALGAWVFHVAALALAPMSVVQVVLASGLVLLAVMADRMFGFQIGLRQWLGLGAMAVGLVLITLTQPAMHGTHSSYLVLAITASSTSPLASTTWTTDMGASASAATWNSHAPRATSMPIENQRERNRPAAEASGWRTSTLGAATAPRCL